MKAEYENLDEWLENPAWREYYETAPSAQCRKLIALEFQYSDLDASDSAEGQEILQEMKAAEETLGTEDWQHLYRYCGNNPRKKEILERMTRQKKG